MNFDAKLIKPGLSLSKINSFNCPLRGYVTQAVDPAEGLPIKEPSGAPAIVGSLVAVGLAEIREKWVKHGADLRVSTTYTSKLEAAKAEEGATDDHVQQAVEIIQGTCQMHAFLPDRKTVAAYWIEERLAFDRQFNRIKFAEKDARWWGNGEQRGRTFFRLIHDFAWLDTEGRGHVEDDKSLGYSDQPERQVHAGAWALFRMVPDCQEASTQYNLLGPKRVQSCGTVTPQDVASFGPWVQEQDARIRGMTEFPAIMQKACDYCGWVHRCPAHQQTRTDLTTRAPESFGAIQTLEQAQAGGLWLLAAERCVKAAKAQLKAYVEEHGAVELPGTGQELRLNPQTEFEVPAVAALNEIGAALVAAGHSPDDVRRLVLGAVTFRWSQVEGVTKKLWPYSGKGVDANAKASAKAVRGPVEGRIRSAGTESPRAATFGVYSTREAA